MGKKKHQFIDKKKAHKFNVVYRSQRDPLQPDEESSQHVLVPAGGGMPDNAGASGSTNSCQEEKVKYGIYYDDDYDYLQHLRPRGEGMLIMAEESAPVPKDDNFGILNLPSEAFPSKYEEDIGMLNKGVLPRGPQPDWDPDIVACLDDDIDLDDPDNILEDDFIKMANDGSYDKSCNDRTTKDDEGEWETESDVSSTGNLDSDDLSDMEDSEEETKSRFTNYSMTSSVIRRTEGLKILDDRFEHIMEEYDEEEIGPIDHEEMAGTFDINNDLMSNIVEEFIQEHTKIPFSETVNEEEADLSENSSDENNEGDDKLFEEFEKKDDKNWDCESIISTYSNIYNHPKLIDEPKVIKLHNRSGIPLGVLKDNKRNDDKTIEAELDLQEPVVLNNLRNKCETPEEKKARKQEVKKYRKDRRKEKKDTKIFFQDEHRKQEQISLNKSNLIAIQ